MIHNRANNEINKEITYSKKNSLHGYVIKTSLKMGRFSFAPGITITI